MNKAVSSQKLKKDVNRWQKRKRRGGNYGRGDGEFSPVLGFLASCHSGLLFL